MKKLVKIAALVALAAFAVGARSAFSQEAAAPKKDIGSKEGQFLADFKINKMGGGEFDSTKELGKKPAIFVIVSPTCTLCRQEVNELNSLAEEVKAKADVYVVVAANENAAKRFAEQGESKFPMLLDDEYALMTAANLRVNPSTLVLAKDGKILKRIQQYQAGQAEALIKSLP